MAQSRLQTKQIHKANYDKGVLLENEFADYMRNELGWAKTRTRAQMKSKLNNHGVNVDIIAFRKDKSGKVFIILSIIYFMMCFLVVGYGYYINDTIVMALGVFIELLAIVVFFMGQSNKYNVGHAWVECKNQGKDLVSNAQIQKTIQDLEAYKASGDKEYNFVVQFFVTTIGYSDQAKKLAHDKGIFCYIQKNSTFEEVTY